MKRLALRNFPRLGFSLAIIVLLSIIGFAFNDLRALIKSNDLVSQTLRVQKSLGETLALFTDAETGERGYIITGEEGFLEPYNTALSSGNGINQHLQELRQLTGDDPGQL